MARPLWLTRCSCHDHRLVGARLKGVIARGAIGRGTKGTNEVKSIARPRPSYARTMDTVTLRGVGGLALAADVDGDPGNPPVILLHGGGQTRHAWGSTLSAL